MSAGSIAACGPANARPGELVVLGAGTRQVVVPIVPGVAYVTVSRR
jgi:hypothetical protein